MGNLDGSANPGAIAVEEERTVAPDGHREVIAVRAMPGGLALNNQLFSAGLGIDAVAEDLTAILLGSRWVDAVPVIRWLALFGTTAQATCSTEAARLFIDRSQRIAASLQLGIALARGGGPIHASQGMRGPAS